MIKQFITNAIILGALVGGLALAKDRTALSIDQVRSFIATQGALTVTLPAALGQTGTLGIRG